MRSLSRFFFEVVRMPYGNVCHGLSGCFVRYDHDHARYGLRHSPGVPYPVAYAGGTKGYSTPNLYTVFWVYTLPTSRRVLGKYGRLGASGKCCVSKHIALLRGKVAPFWPS